MTYCKTSKIVYVVVLVKFVTQLIIRYSMEKPTAPGGCRWVHFINHADTCVPPFFKGENVFISEGGLYKIYKVDFANFLGSKSTYT